MKKRSITGILFLSLTLFLNVQLQAQTATEIIRKATQQFHGNTNYAELTMKIVRPDWTREISIKSWSKGENYGLVLVTAPARDKGTVYLKRGREVWNWVPSIERSVKLPPSMMSQSWMGSDFTNDDLVRESSLLNDFDHALDGSEKVNETDCFRIILTPKPDAPVVWSKIICWVSKDHYLQLRTAFYDEDDALVNTLSAGNVKNMSGRMIPTHVEMIPAGEPGNKTVMDYAVIVYDKPIEDDFFSLQNIKNVR